MVYLALFFSLSLFAQTPLHERAELINKDLPENYDKITRLRKTTVENDELVFHFIVLATTEEFSMAFPKVKEQVLRTICRQSREGRVLRELKAPVIYRYENEKGQALGEFVVRPGHCQK